MLHSGSYAAHLKTMLSFAASAATTATLHKAFQSTFGAHQLIIDPSSVRPH